MSDKKLFFVVDDGNSSLSCPEGDLFNIIRHGFDEYDKNTPEDELPIFKVSPIWMTQEEYEAMPEYNG